MPGSCRNTLPAWLCLLRHAFLPIFPEQWGALFWDEEKSGCRTGSSGLGGSWELLLHSWGLSSCAGPGTGTPHPGQVRGKKTIK